MSKRLTTTLRQLSAIAAIAFTAGAAHADKVTTLDDGVSFGTWVQISQKNDGFPANDLMYQGRKLTPHEALQLKAKGLDLSTLDPDRTTDIWAGKDKSIQDKADDQLPASNMQTLDFRSTFAVYPDMYAATVQGAKPMRLFMGVTLHTHLLRKELLRRMGYNVPASKWVPVVKVRFPNADVRHAVLHDDIASSTGVNAQRWCFATQKLLDDEQARDKTLTAASLPCRLAPASYGLKDDLEVAFQDVMVTDSFDPYYNLSVTAPTSGDSSAQLVGGDTRILRVLALIYGLVDTPESINQLQFYVSNVTNQNITFTLPDKANFNCSLDDARWFMRRLLKIDRATWSDMIDKAHFPPAVGKILLEKVIARRNSLIQPFGLQAAAIPADQSNYNMAPDLVNMKLIRQDWPGYASRFAWGDPDSPLAHLKYYLFSVMEGNAISNAVHEFNTKVVDKYTSVDERIKQHNEDLAQKMLRHYLTTHQPGRVKFGPWISAPVFEPSLGVDREIIAGPYMGTGGQSDDRTANILQLSDTVSLGARIGVYIGLNALPTATSLSSLISASYTYSFSHIKPVTDLKAAFNTPMKDLFVPLFMRDADRIMRATAAFKSKMKTDATTNVESVDDATRKIINDDMTELSKYLDIGDSFLITQSIDGGPDIRGSVGTGATLAPSAELSVEVNPQKVIITRIHIYRKDATTLQIFRDDGELLGLNANAEISFDLGPAKLPIFEISASKLRGHADTKIMTANVDTDLTRNPTYFDQVAALAQTFKLGNKTTLLEKADPPAKLAVQFSDFSFTRRILIWVKRVLKQSAIINAWNTDGDTDSYIQLSDGVQKGVSFQVEFNDVVNFILQRLTKKTDFDFSSPVADNPGSTFLGHSQTRETTFVARTTQGISEPYVQVETRWEGWKKKAAEAMAILNGLNQRYGYHIYDQNVLWDTKMLQLYEIQSDLHVYRDAINIMVGETPAKEAQFVATYCQTVPQQHDCPGALRDFDKQWRAFHVAQTNDDKGHTILAMVSDIEKAMPFKDLVAFFGGPDNIYLTSEIQAFRVGSETMSDPIKGSSFGKSDPVNPNGVVKSAQSILGIEDGEMYQRWLRDVL